MGTPLSLSWAHLLGLETKGLQKLWGRFGDWFLGRDNPEQGGFSGVERGGGLKALLAAFPKLPGVLFEGRGEGELPSPSLEGNGDRSWGVFPGTAPPAPSLLWPAQPKTWPWGRQEGRWEASTDEGAGCRAVAHPSATSFSRFWDMSHQGADPEQPGC